MSHEIDRMTYIPIKINDTPYLAITGMEGCFTEGFTINVSSETGKFDCFAMGLLPDT